MKSKRKKFLKSIAFILIIAGFIFIGTQEFDSNIEVDNERFDHDYKNVSADNVFSYVNASEVYAALKGGDSIIFMGYPQNKWSGYYANILNESAKEVGIDKILYYDFWEDRENKNAVYQSIILKLSSYLNTVENDTQEILAPSLIIVKNGKVIHFDNETAINIGTITPEDYWSIDKTSLKLNNFKTLFQDYLKN